ncbi:MAG: bifunctional [glutamate--ammonia ligase]-adenylyl-L-tyrosine phosphorylase/[glutamate--ammonia-ligase] adenylyltransferase, partial [Burkholderiaceae bacterium]
MAGFDGIAALMAELDRHRHCVAAEFDTIFGEPTGEAPQDGTGNMPPIGDCDSEDAMAAALAEIGFADPSGAARRLAATWQSPRLRSLPDASRGRLVALVNAALPLVADTAGANNAGPAQDAALGRLLDFLETVARRAAYLALLTEYPAALARLIRILRASGWAAGYLTRHPILLDELLDERTLHAAPDWETFAADCRARLDTADGDAERQMDILREMHHAQLFRLLAKDLDGLLSVERLADYLSMLADILVELTIGAVWRTIPNRHRETPRFAVIAYGKLGGKELGYASDLDVVFLYDDDDQDAPPLYAKLAQRFITWMTSHTAAGVLFDVDIALRPDGASGLLVSSVGSFEKYQTQSAWIWEHQALTRARCCAGDAAIGARFETLRDAVLRQPRDPAVLRTAVLDMRARMRAQHRPRDGQFDLKQDAGGMIDIEFIVQFLILRDAAQLPQLTADIGNIALLKLAGELGLIDAASASAVADAYRLFRRLQHQLRLQGEEHARVAEATVQEPAGAVIRLWDAVLGAV